MKLRAYTTRLAKWFFMTIGERKKLINDMIRENPDATIKDYLQLVKEFDQIRKTTNEAPVVWFMKVRTEELNRPKIKHPISITTINSR